MRWNQVYDPLGSALFPVSNSSGGVMDKKIGAQSIVVASTAMQWDGGEAKILRYAIFHAIALACLVNVLVMLQACVPPFTAMVPTTAIPPLAQ